jgi:hypothetical protein
MAMFEFFHALDHLLPRFDFALVDPARAVPISTETLTSPAPGALPIRLRRRRAMEGSSLSA